MNDTNNRVPVKLNGQDVNIQNREKIKVTGVNDIIGFDETFVDIETELGKMLIRGEGHQNRAPEPGAARAGDQRVRI